MAKKRLRCPWCLASLLEQTYHDEVWGVPKHDDQGLFEFLILEGAQAGLSWSTILKKQEGYRAAFLDFDISKVARFSEKKIARLLQNPGIVRNRLKVRSAVSNAKATLEVIKAFGSLDAYLWDFVDGRTIQNHWKTMGEIPPNTDISDAMSGDMKKRGFNFVGSTICYAFMQAVGMVNDHITSCYRHAELR